MSSSHSSALLPEAQLLHALERAYHKLYTQGFLTGTPAQVGLSPPKQPHFGDVSSNICMLTAAHQSGKSPRDIAHALLAELGDAQGLLAETTIAGPGFLNFRFHQHVWGHVLESILHQKQNFLAATPQEQPSILLEFVSANPTGPLHVAHGRGAALGDVLARVLRTAGYSVTTEYYINDQGHQVDVLVDSVCWRIEELRQNAPIPPPAECYPGDYVKEIATAWLNHDPSPTQTDKSTLRTFALDFMMKRIQNDLAAFHVHFDRFQSEQSLCTPAAIEDVIRRLDEKNLLYRDENSRVWFASTRFGDDKDRVLIREDGRPTYFTTDIIYHHNKLSRGFQRLINIWGADHGGYVNRLQAAITALSPEHTPSALEVVLVQMVSLSRGGEAVKMGKRLGTAVWLEEVIQQAGADATRYLFLTRCQDAQMDFDLDVACQKSLKNPVYYAQMGHARLCAIARRAEEAGFNLPHPLPLPTFYTTWLTLPEEIDLIKALSQAPKCILQAATHLEPHQLVFYLQRLVAAFHSYYTKYRHTEKIISQDYPEKTLARLCLCEGLRLCIQALLHILGVAAPEEMSLEDETTESS
jgi:arginyl-tRNA synthetase